ncbi:MAG: deoxyribose-phosphate aldolase [Actinobacteria bacterium]|nr:MAG: deoxyribose-phosphate aldolase [Actinomycetota bacterium]
MDARILAQMIDHTLLAPEATMADVERLCAEAIDLQVGAICISPSHLPLTKGLLPSSIKTAAVVGFPSGAHNPSVKSREAQQACEYGANEIDMVTNLALVSSANWSAITGEVSAVRAAIPSGVIIKVIIESALWNDKQIVAVCSAAVLGGADFVKTSTGFHKSGGASIAAVQLMRRTVGETIGVKASGGIRTYADAIAMIEAGASRIGASASRVILAEAQ